LGFVLEECALKKDVSTTWTGYDDLAADLRSLRLGTRFWRDVFALTVPV
jgi:hypothetical protein